MKHLCPSLRRTARVLAAALIGAASAAQAAQVTTLADFEAPGSLTSWVTLGDVSLQFNANAALPDTGDGVGVLALTTASTEYEDDYPAAAGAFNLSGHAALDASAAGGLASSLGLAPNGLDSGSFAFEGSASSIEFQVAAGATLSFRWNLLTTDTLFPDAAFVLLDGQRIDLANALQATQSVGGAYAAGGQTGWQTTTIALSQAGTVRLSFGIVDADDAGATSALLVDQVAVTTPVPEAQAWVLMTGGLLLMGAAAARRRNRR